MASGLGRGRLLQTMLAKKQKDEEEKTTTPTSTVPKSTSPEMLSQPPTVELKAQSEQATTESSASGVSSPSLMRKTIPTSMPSPDRHAFRSLGRGMMSTRPKEPVKPEIPILNPPLQTSAPLVQPKTSPEKPGIRSIGRGSLLSRQNRSPSRENRTETTFQPVQPEPQHQQPLTTVVVQHSQPEQPAASVAETRRITPDAILPPAPLSPRLTGRGRGMLMSRVAQAPVTTTVAAPPPPVVVQTLPPTQPEIKSATMTTTTIEKAVTTTTTTIKSQMSSINPADEPGRTSQPTQRTNISSVLLSVTSTTNRSIERAMEELKIEQIARQSPVKRCGEAGTRQTYTTNYVRLKGRKEGVFQYVVYFDPPIDSQYIRVKLVTNGLKELIGPARLFDGFTLFLPKLLKDPVTCAKCERKPGDPDSVVNIKIQLTKILPAEYIPPVVFNIIFKNIMKELKMSRIGQHYFSPVRQIDLVNQNLQIWPGYTTAVHEQEDGLYLVVDVAHKVLRSQTCLDLIRDLFNKSTSDLQSFRQRVHNLIVGNIVLTKYNNRTYKVDDIVWEDTPETEFSYRQERISYYEYYKRHYDIEIKDLKQPLLLHRSKTKPPPGVTLPAGKAPPTEVICLVPELCFMTGLTDEMRADMTVKKELSSHTRLTPSQRYEQLRKLVNEIRSTKEAYQWIVNWNLELDADLTVLDGRALPMEKLIFAKREVETDFRCDWTRACAMEECLRAVEMRQWMCVYPGNRENIVAKFVELACEVGVKIGVRISMPMTVPLRDDRPDSYYQEIKRNLCDGVQIVVVVLPMLSDSRYTRVKRLLCVENAIPSQVVVLKTISKPDNVLRTVAQKIVLQMNCKLGGELWRVSIPIKKIMIVGIDVYHKVEQKYKSIAGFVSSLNPEQTRWYSRVCFQMTGQELADSLKIAFLQAIKKYREANGYFPDKIFIFRDGVSEGQLSTVADHEVAQFRACFTGEFCPQIAVIVVQKRISTRMFTSSGGQPANPKPGGIIDSNITGRDSYDFFLVSQHVTQGTVTPTHYIVAYDDTNYKPDYIQRLSYKMTHMYYNWSGTIRVPAPCQYAHKLAFLTGQYLQNEADERLCDRLFFL